MKRSTFHYCGHLEDRSSRDVQKIRKISIGSTTGFFSRIVGDAEGGTPQHFRIFVLDEPKLLSDSVKLTFFEVVRETKQGAAQGCALPPDLHILEAKEGIGHSQILTAGSAGQQGKQRKPAWT